MPMDQDIWLAIQKTQGEEFVKRLLQLLNGSRYPIELGGATSDDELSVALVLELEIQIPSGIKPFEITPNGGIRGTFTGVVRASSLHFSFKINRAWPPFLPHLICLKKVYGFCVAWWIIVMPPLPRIRFRIPFGDLIPIYAATFSADIKDIVGRRNNDKLELKAKFKALRPRLTPNPAALLQAITATLYNVVKSTLGRIPVLGPFIKYVAGFIKKIVDVILGAANMLTAVDHYLRNKLHGLVVDWIEDELWDPTVDIKVGQMSRKVKIAEAVNTPQGLPPVHLYLESIKIDVNTNCHTGHELRVVVDVDEGS